MSQGAFATYFTVGKKTGPYVVSKKTYEFSYETNYKKSTDTEERKLLAEVYYPSAAPYFWQSTVGWCHDAKNILTTKEGLKSLGFQQGADLFGYINIVTSQKVLLRHCNLF